MSEKERIISCRKSEGIDGTCWVLFGFVGADTYIWPADENGQILLFRQPTPEEVEAFDRYLADPSNESNYPPLPAQ
jgi:hypothetical protein